MISVSFNFSLQYSGVVSFVILSTRRLWSGCPPLSLANISAMFNKRYLSGENDSFVCFSVWKRLNKYLLSLQRYLCVGSDWSPAVSCEYGVAQGSILGPMLFATYIAPIAGVISSFGIHHTQYADDTQLYIELRDSDTLPRLYDCFRSVHSWFVGNGLALNPDKSEVIVIGTGARNRKEGGISAVTLGDTLIAVSKTAKSLGVTLDETPSIAKSTMLAKLLISTLELCVISGGASTMKLHGQWLARWSVHGSTIVTRSFMERPLETSARSKGWSTRWRGCSRVPGNVITSRQFWLIYTGFQSRQEYDSKSRCRYTKRLPRRNQSISPILSVSRLHRDHSGLAQQTVSMLTLPGLALPVALFVMRRCLFRMLFLFTWQIFQNLWIPSKNNSKHSCTIRHTVNNSPFHPRLRFNLFIFLICFHWHMARHQLCIIIISFSSFMYYYLIRHSESWSIVIWSEA